ncbi:MAG: hypothetical protein ACLTXL_16610 [Clostridia bacterium]
MIKTNLAPFASPNWGRERTAAFIGGGHLCWNDGDCICHRRDCKGRRFYGIQFTLRNGEAIPLRFRSCDHGVGRHGCGCAEDVRFLGEDQKISVTIAGTDYYRNQMVLEIGTRGTMRYQIVTGRSHPWTTVKGSDEWPGDCFLYWRWQRNLHCEADHCHNVKPGDCGTSHAASLW